MKQYGSIAVSLTVVLLWATPSRTQTTQGTGLSSLKSGVEQFDVRNLLGRGVTLPTLPSVPLQEAIDPKKYVVGPSDIFSVNIWLGTGFSYQSAVTPEGSLIIPTVGEVRVAGLTLAEAKRRTVERVRKTYADGEITVTLISPRTFVVYVTGLVAREGPYVVTAITRVDQVVSLANIPVDTAMVAQALTTERLPEEMWAKGIAGQRPKKKAEEGSTRNITIKRSDGTARRVDLAMYYGTGDESYNSHLIEGDIVFVPRKNAKENFIRVSGAVTLPDGYEFIEGDRLLDALAASRGLTPLADSSSVELIRFDEVGSNPTTIKFDLRKVLAEDEPNVLLSRGDRIVAHQQVVVNKDFTVRVEGEVRSPGVYPITKNSTMLSEIVKMAGGFTDHAYVKGGTVVRDAGTYNYREVSPGFELMLYTRSPEAQPWDSTYYFLDARVKKRAVNVDFKKLFEDRDSSQDIVLYDEDYVYVPSMKKMVYVYGQVANPGYVPWVEGVDYRHYIRLASGYSDNADEGGTRVIKGRTLEWMEPGGAAVEIGDNIYVPSKQRRRFDWYVTTVSQGAAILGAVLGSIALVIQLNR